MRERLERELSDRYAIERELGRGGMASVWLARDRRDDRAVAIKVLDADLAGAIGADRFVREIRLTTRLQHPRHRPRARLGRAPRRRRRRAAVVRDAVHRRRVAARAARSARRSFPSATRCASRAKSPARCSSRTGRGSCTATSSRRTSSSPATTCSSSTSASRKALLDTGAERLTSTGLAIGTPAYMSPEQATAAPVDARTDQYSLAAVLYEMLVGEPPLTGPNAQAIIARRLTGARAVDPHRAADAVPAASSRRCCARSSACRRTGSPTSRRSPPRSMARAARASRRAGARGARGSCSAVPRSPSSRRSRRRWRSSVAATPPASVDPQIVALYQRGERAYDRRTPAGRARRSPPTAPCSRATRASRARGSGSRRRTSGSIQRRFELPGVSTTACGARPRLGGPRARRRQHRRAGVGGAGARAAHGRSDRRGAGHPRGATRHRARLPRRALRGTSSR